MSDEYRIECKEDATYNGEKVTLFSLLQRKGRAYFFVGRFKAPNHGASDKACIRAYESKIAKLNLVLS